MKVLAAILLILSLYKMHLCTKDWKDIVNKEVDDNNLMMAKGFIATESAIELFCSLFILFV